MLFLPSPPAQHSTRTRTAKSTMVDALITPALLSCLDVRFLAAVGAASRVLRHAAGAGALWAPHFLLAFPA